jgi:hypothetical protein
MDRLLVAASVTVPLIVALTGTIWYLVALVRRDRQERNALSHRFRGQGEAVTVAELVEDAVERGEAIRLNWSADDIAETGRVRPYAQDQFPTTILPKIDDFGES